MPRITLTDTALLLGIARSTLYEHLKAAGVPYGRRHPMTTERLIALGWCDEARVEHFLGRARPPPPTQGEYLASIDTRLHNLENQMHALHDLILERCPERPAPTPKEPA